MNPNKSHPISIAALFLSLWKNRSLISQMTRREVIGRYRGSVMGLAWSFFNPILMLGVYTFVFSGVFKARWLPGGDESKATFAIALFVGLIVYGLFAECVNRAPGLILSNVNFVKKVVFPLEVLPWVALFSALFHAMISLAVLVVAQLLIMQSLPWTAVFFPLLLLPLMFSAMGLAWFLSALGVYLRDVSQVTGMLTTALMFLSPVFYPIASLPPHLQGVMKMNPLAFLIEEGRATLVFGRTPDLGAWTIMLAIGILIAWAGFAWFQRTRRGFADVL